ncbi:MAG TPA: MarR family transcriptional regulator [Silvibacterium sp.]|nr:MarR family transcriptional regulator [Silvibacterium sp.]
MKQASARTHPVDSRQATALHECVAALLRQFKLEPGVLAGSAYADLHANDIGLLQVLAEPGDWNVRGIAQAFRAPVSTISSALDRLETRRVVSRQRRPGNRRTVYIELTAAGLRLAARLRAAQIENCRLMLAQLAVDEREELIRLVAQIARG